MSINVCFSTQNETSYVSTAFGMTGKRSQTSGNAIGEKTGYRPKSKHAEAHTLIKTFQHVHGAPKHVHCTPSMVPQHDESPSIFLLK